MRAGRAILPALVIATGAALALARPVPAAASPNPNTCTGALPGNFPPTDGGPLRFGVNPRVQAGQIGPVPAPALAEDRARQLAALHQLAADRPFVVRLNRVFWPEPAGQLEALDRDIQGYSAAGYLVELQLRYHPSTGPADPAAFATWAAGLVHRYDSSSALVSAQVTNEVNFAVSQDSSDGAFPGARDALILGVERVKQQAVSDGASQVKVGFNWFYRTDGHTEEGFWGYLGSHGGVAFKEALDWVGLDAYPGTYFPPVEPGFLPYLPLSTNGYYGGMVNAMSVLHECFMPYGGLAGKAIYIEETGYPTDLALRTVENQDQALRELVAAAHDYGHRYNVIDFRWFNLRDADSSSPNFQQHFGLLNSDYSRKPAFCTYRRVVTGLADCPPAAASGPTPVEAATLEPGRGGLPPTSARGAVESGLAVFAAAVAVILLSARPWARRDAG
ncbi:MAG: hypothetical protein M3010_09200 [Candidatus Dormibacteraeota bacterium]|nr:hypothetical protein [Candidatus Dormibacteraeota bacterium]